MKFVFSIFRNILRISHNGGPLPPDIEASFCSQLRYVHLYQVRGPDAYDPVTGNYSPTRAEHRLLYSKDDKGLLLCSVGWQYRLARQLRELGHEVQIEDYNPPHPRPDRYVVDWDAAFELLDLRPSQDEILAAMETRNQAMIEVPPGVGKTFLIAAYALAHPKARIHVISDGIDILKRIYSHLLKYTGGVGFVGAGKCEFSRITVISADSLHKVADGFDDPNSPRAADVVIFDEVHRAAAPRTLQHLYRYYNCKMYGLSGSVHGRFDNASAQLEGVFGEIVYSMHYSKAAELGLVVPIMVEWIRMDLRTDPAFGRRTTTAKERWGIWRNEERNERIAQRARDFGPDVQVLILVSKFEHAVELKQFLPEYKLCYSPRPHDDLLYDRYVRDGKINPRDEPKMTLARRDELRDQFSSGQLKKVICTDVWSTGVDFPSLQVLIRADGRASGILDTQIPGRVARVHEDKEFGLVIDCYDEFNRTFLFRSNVRKRNYMAKGWKMIGLPGKRKHHEVV